MPTMRSGICRKKTPPEPTIDILKYVIENSPRHFQEWEKDILSTIRGQALYFLPYRRTKIMNEGWATYWHEKIMNRLFAEKFLSAEEHGYYNLYNSRVKAHNPRTLNPYLLGSALFNNIEMRWNTGRFGPEYEACSDALEKENWDLHLNKGLEKIMEVRRTHMDWFFIDEFLNRQVVEDLQLYIYHGIRQRLARGSRGEGDELEKSEVAAGAKPYELGNTQDPGGGRKLPQQLPVVSEARIRRPAA